VTRSDDLLAVSDRNCSDIGENSEENDQIDSNSFAVRSASITSVSDELLLAGQSRRENSLENKHREYEVNFQVKTQSDTVDDIRPHPVKDFTTDFDGGDDCRESFIEENDICGTSSGIGSVRDSYSAIGLLEGGRVVDTI